MTDEFMGVTDPAALGADAGGAQASPRPRSRAQDGPGGITRMRRPPQERLTAIVDGRFWWWLHDDDSQAGGGLLRAQEALLALAEHHGARLVRTLWYSDQEHDSSPAGLQWRRIPSNAQDHGVTMLRAMGQDLSAMAEHKSVDRVLLVTDDDRLLLSVDNAQRRGLMVDMLVDAQWQGFESVRDEDPSWASLLQLADRVVKVGGSVEHVRGQRAQRGPQGEGGPRREAPSAHASGIIENEILAWWEDETQEQRAHWCEEIQGSRGIPQELDRQLLLRISRRLGQALSPGEKAAMRHQVRQTVLDEGSAGNRADDSAGLRV